MNTTKRKRIRSASRTGKKKKVFVGLSGGVDSSVSAALLARAGYEVTGVFIKVWQPPGTPCTWREDRRDAMRAAAHLGIPLITLDLEEEYRRDVVDSMIAEYRAGRTPNPDVACNRHIKFGAFFRRAIRAGADFVATGHYARIQPAVGKENKNAFELLAGNDKEKDQSYFLWTLTQHELARTFFPVGGYQKREVRAMALKFGLPNAEKKDSQGLCFIGKLDMKEFLSRYIPPRAGVVLTTSGIPIGEHPGAAFFTLGERHGFSVTPTESQQGPYYVVAKDIERNTITVSHLPYEAAACDGKLVKLSSVNWIATPPRPGDQLAVRARYREPLVLGTLVSYTPGDGAVFRFDEPHLAPPGQSLVLYRRAVCAGGGVIEG